MLEAIISPSVIERARPIARSATRVAVLACAFATASCGADSGTAGDRPMLMPTDTGGGHQSANGFPADQQNSTSDPAIGTDPGPGAPPTRDTSIQFSWPEANLGALGGPPCKSGRYLGQFQGVYTSPATVIGIPLNISGDVDFTLLEAQSGEFFEISEGKVIGVASTAGDPNDPNGVGNGVPFSADIIGRLNCATGMLENAGLTNGFYEVLGILTPFEGPVTGMYDRNTSTFVNGTWSVVEPNAAPNFGGNGIWDAVKAP